MILLVINKQSKLYKKKKKNSNTPKTNWSFAYLMHMLVKHMLISETCEQLYESGQCTEIFSALVTGKFLVVVMSFHSFYIYDDL